jgi:hypothetical protein
MTIVVQLETGVAQRVTAAHDAAHGGKRDDDGAERAAADAIERIKVETLASEQQSTGLGDERRDASARVLQEHRLVGVDNEGLVKCGGRGESIDDLCIFRLSQHVALLLRQLPQFVHLAHERRRIAVSKRNVKYGGAFEKCVRLVSIVRLHVHDLVRLNAHERTGERWRDEASQQRSALIETESSDVAKRHTHNGVCEVFRIKENRVSAQFEPASQCAQWRRRGVLVGVAHEVCGEVAEKHFVVFQQQQ